MEPPHIKLVILQGPREGETLGFEPSKVVRIGRIVRNNTLSIKDAGISSNHLSILIESGKWVLRDLDSSNGTFLNGSVIPPNTPFDLRHGDNIKIGELTSIQVDLQAQEGSCLRRNPRRQATGKASSAVREKLEVKDEKLEWESSERVAVLEPVEERRGRPRKRRGLKSEVGEEFSKAQLQNIDENVEVGSELKDVVPLQETVEPPVNKRATRNSKKKQQQQQQIVVGAFDSSNVKNSTENSGLKSGVGEDFSKVQLQNIDENVGVGSEFTDEVPLQEKVEPPVKKRVTRNTKKQQQQSGIGTSKSSNVTNSTENSGLKSGVGEDFSKVQLHNTDENAGVGSEFTDEVPLQGKVEPPVKRRPTRNTKKQQQQSGIGTSNSSNVTNSTENSGLKSGVGEEFGKVQLQSIDEHAEVGNELKNVVPLQENIELPVNKPVTRNSKNKQQQQIVIATSNSSIVTNSTENSGFKCTEENIVAKEAARAGTRSRKLQEETSLCDQVAISEDMVQEARDNTGADQNPGVNEGGFEEDESKKVCGSDEEACSNKREGEEACSSQRKDSSENGDWPNLDKLTLGEWFDFLEVHLPTQIIDATEEMIDSMKEKAERVRDYMEKQRNDKATLPEG